MTGPQSLNDSAVGAGLAPTDPFWQEGFCSPFSLPHCHHHGDQGNDPCVCDDILTTDGSMFNGGWRGDAGRSAAPRAEPL